MHAYAKMAGIGTLALALVLSALYFGSAAPPVPAPSKAEPDLFAFVRSMQGTRPDGDIKTSTGAQLVVDAELGHLFDYYLAGLGEKDLAAIKAEIERELERRLAAAPAAQAKQLLAQYLAYKQALAGIETKLPKDASMAQSARARLQAMRQLRPDFFTPEQSAGLFGASDARDDDAIARLAIDADQTLDAAQKQARLAALDGQLTAAQRAERDAPTQVMRLEESVQQLRANGAGDNEVYRVRAAAISPEAAARLADVDREEAAWQGRISAYLAQRAAVTGDAARLQQLRDSSFTPDEQRRLGAYE